MCVTLAQHNKVFIGFSISVNTKLFLRLQEYEVNANKYCSTLGKPNIDANKAEYVSMAESVQKKVGSC